MHSVRAASRSTESRMPLARRELSCEVRSKATSEVTTARTTKKIAAASVLPLTGGLPAASEDATQTANSHLDPVRQTRSQCLRLAWKGAKKVRKELQIRRRNLVQKDPIPRTETLALEWEAALGYLCTSRGIKGELRPWGEEIPQLLNF